MHGVHCMMKCKNILGRKENITDGLNITVTITMNMKYEHN